MKLRNFISLLLLFCCVHTLSAQDDESFLFDKFEDGAIHYRGGVFSKEKLNYNVATGRFWLIHEGKPLEIPEIGKIVILKIGNRTFYPEKDGGIEILPTTPTIYVQYKAHASPQRTVGINVASTETSSVSKYGSIQGDTDHRVYEAKKMDVRKLYNIYWIERNDRKKEFRNFKQFLKLYPKHKATLQQYIDENKVQFNNVEMITKLCLYAESL